MSPRTLGNPYVSPEGGLTVRAVVVYRRAYFGRLKGEPPVTETDLEEAEELQRLFSSAFLDELHDELRKALTSGLNRKQTTPPLRNGRGGAARVKRWRVYSPCSILACGNYQASLSPAFKTRPRRRKRCSRSGQHFPFCRHRGPRTSGEKTYNSASKPRFAV